MSRKKLCGDNVRSNIEVTTNLPPTHPSLKLQLSFELSDQLVSVRSPRAEPSIMGREFPRRLCDPLPQYDFIVSAVVPL